MNEVGSVINERDQLKSKLESISSVQQLQQQKITKLLGENLKLRKEERFCPASNTNSKVIELIINAFETRIDEIEQVEKEYRTTNSKSKYRSDVMPTVAVSIYTVLQKYR